MKKELKKVIIIASLFAIAMAFLETAVVIYLRELFYPEGFDFPLKPMDLDLALVEILREFATIVMLGTLAFFIGKNAPERFAYFLFCFAVWDIFYYVFLKLFINWPLSFQTFDILFLIPTVWVAPVIAPVILSVLMIVLAIAILKNNQRDASRIAKKEWIYLIAGSIVAILSFTIDYLQAHITQGSFSNQKAMINSYIPDHFSWPLFVAGTLLIVYGITLYITRNSRQTSFLKQAQLF